MCCVLFALREGIINLYKKSQSRGLLPLKILLVSLFRSERGFTCGLTLKKKGNVTAGRREMANHVVSTQTWNKEFDFLLVKTTEASPGKHFPSSTERKCFKWKSQSWRAFTSRQASCLFVLRESSAYLHIQSTIISGGQTTMFSQGGWLHCSPPAVARPWQGKKLVQHLSRLNKKKNVCSLPLS